MLDEISISYENIILCGDCNVDFHLNDSRFNALRGSISFVGLKMLNSLATHYAPYCKPTFLDLVCVPSSSLSRYDF